MRIVLVIFSVVMWAGCAAGPRLIDPRDFSRAKRVVTLSDGGAFSANYFYVLMDDQVVMEVSTPKENSRGNFEYVAKQSRKTLDAATAARVWKNVDELKILEWRERYRPKDLGVEIVDGTTWSIYLRTGGVEKDSGGFNVYPALSPMGSPTLENDSNGKPVPTAYYALLELLRELMKEA